MIRNALLLFGICATIFVVFLPSYLQMQELHDKNTAYERKVRELGQENEALLEEKRRLEEDPAYFERFAREKFGIIKDGEVIYKIVPAGTPGVPATVNSQVTNKSQAPVGDVKKKARSISKSGATKGAAKKSAVGQTTKKRPVKSIGLGNKEHSDLSSDKNSE